MCRAGLPTYCPCSRKGKYSPGLGSLPQAPSHRGPSSQHPNSLPGAHLGARSARFRDPPKWPSRPRSDLRNCTCRSCETWYAPSSPHDRAVLRSSDLRYGLISRYGTIGTDLPKSDEIARTGQRAHSARIPRRPEVAHGPSSQPPPAGRMRTWIAPTAADLGSAKAGPGRPLRVPIRSVRALFWRLGEANTSPPHAPGPKQSSQSAQSQYEGLPSLQDA